MQDLFNALHPVPAIPPAAAVTSDTPLQSLTIDRQGFASATFVILTGALADADATFAVELEHADTDWSGAAAVPDEFLLGTEALAGFDFGDDNACRKLGYVGDKRYLRLKVTPAGNTGNAFIAAVALLGHPAVGPTVNPPQP